MIASNDTVRLIDFVPEVKTTGSSVVAVKLRDMNPNKELPSTVKIVTLRGAASASKSSRVKLFDELTVDTISHIDVNDLLQGIRNLMSNFFIANDCP